MGLSFGTGHESVLPAHVAAAGAGPDRRSIPVFSMHTHSCMHACPALFLNFHWRAAPAPAAAAAAGPQLSERIEAHLAALVGGEVGRLLARASMAEVVERLRLYQDARAQGQGVSSQPHHPLLLPHSADTAIYMCMYAAPCQAWGGIIRLLVSARAVPDAST